MQNLQEARICKSCGNTFTGLYCNLCGEKIIEPADRSFRAFLSNIFLAVTFADSKFLRTLWLVIKSPGFVSKEFAEGRRMKYLKPLSLFFVLNLIYFLFPLIQIFSASYRTQLNTSYGKIVQEMSVQKMVGRNISVTAFEVIYNEKSVGLAKLMVIVFVIIASLPLNVLYLSRSRFFTDHVGLTVELACFNLFVNALLVTLLARFTMLGHYLGEYGLAAIFISTNLYFLLRAGFIFYDETNWRLVIKSLVMLVVLRAALEVYRFILFFVTLWTL